MLRKTEGQRWQTSDTSRKRLLVTALQRNRAQLLGQHGGLTAAIAEAYEAISERHIQKIQIDEDFLADTLELLDQVCFDIIRLEEQKV